MGQIIKSEKIINNREYVLYGVDAEIFSTILSSGYLDSLIEADELDNYIYLCFGDGHHTNIIHAQNLISILLNRILGFDCSSLCNLLSLYEQTGKFHKSYREHLSHQLRVYFVGICLIIKNKYIHKELLEVYKTNEEIIRVWTVTALAHDWGYVFEWGNPSLSNHDDKSLKVINEFLSDPIRMFFPDKGDSEFLPKQKEEIINNASINPSTITSFSNIQNEEAVKTAFKKVEGYAKKTRIGGKEGFGLQSYYDFMRKYTIEMRDAPYCDHGIVSAYILLWLAVKNQHYKNKLSSYIFDNDDEVKKQISLSKDSYDTAVSAACAIALHNIRKYSRDIQNKAYDEYKITLNRYRIEIHKNPLAYLLVLTDSIQEWERPSYLAEDDRDFQAQDMHLIIDETNVYLCFPTDSLAMRGTTRSRFEIIQQSINSLLADCSPSLLISEIDMNELFEKVKNSNLKDLIVASVDKKKRDNKKRGKSKAFELYRTGRRYANEANFEMAINLQTEAAFEFNKINELSWQSRSLGRVAFSSIYFGIQEEDVTKNLKQASDLDKWQGAANYYWIIDHCLKSNTSKKTEFKFFSILLKELSELECIDLQSYYSSSNKDERYDLFRSGLVLFFDQLIKRERDAKWPSWAMSDLPRLYLLRAEENHLTSIRYLTMAEEAFNKMELTSYAAWTNCKKNLLSIQLNSELHNNDVNGVISSLQKILLSGRNILQSPRKERHLIKFFLTVVEFYYVLLRYVNLEIDSYEECEFLLKGIETSDIYERDTYIKACAELLEEAKKNPNREDFIAKLLTSLDYFKNLLVWIENEKIKELIYLHMVKE